MAQGNAVGAGDLTEGDLTVGGREDHDQAEEASTRQIEGATLEVAGTAEDDSEHAGHVEGVVAGQEDVGHAGEAGQDDVERHAEGHDDGRAGAEVLECVGDDGLVVGNDALHVEGVVEQLAKREQGAGLQERSTGRQDQESHDGLDGALGDVLDGLALEGEADEGEEPDQDSRRRQNVDYEVEYCHVSPFKSKRTCFVLA